MPKSAPRRKRIRTARVEADPIALPEEGSSTSSKADRKQTQKQSTTKKPTAGQERDKHLGPVLQKLSSDSADDRLWAVAATSHILANADAGTRRALQSKNIVGILIDRLADDVTEVQAEACGALRNLAIEGGYEVCAEMYNKNVAAKLTPQLATVSQALNNFISGVAPANDEEVRVRKVLWAWIEHLATLFWCLAETSDKAFKSIVTIQPLSELLYTILRNAVPVDGSSVTTSKIPAGVALAAAQAVYVLTDVNVPSAPKFPLPRDVSVSAAHLNTRTMLLESLRNLSSSFESTSSSSTPAASSSSPSQNSSEQVQSLLVMLIGIYQNLSQQRAFGKQAAAEIEEQEQDFTRLTLRILASLLTTLDIQKDAQIALEAQAALPSTTSSISGKDNSTTLSSEAVEVSSQKRTLDGIEARWTRIRLALEILGEMVAGVDGILDPALLGVEEYEEWTGIQEEEKQQDKDSGMNAENENEHADMDAAEQKNTTKAATTNGFTQSPLSISTDIRQLLSNLPATLLSLGKPSSISFTSPKPLIKETPSIEQQTLIPTQINTETVATSTAHTATDSSTSYVPAVSELFSLVHVRALECLNNLLITLDRSVSQSPEATDDKAKKDGDDYKSEDAEDLDMAEDMDGDSDTLEDDDDDDEESVTAEEVMADFDGEMNGQSHSVGDYITDNLSTFQTVFEGLFHTLVDYQASLKTTLETSTQSKKNDSTLESLLLVVEADVGSIWALLRLCGEQLTIGKDEHKLLIQILQLSSTSQGCDDIAVRCIGALGQLAMRQSVTVAENETIGKALLALLDDSKLSPLKGSDIGKIEVLSQALDTIFDVYGEETRAYDSVFRQLGFLSTLQAVLPTFKRLTKSVDKRKYPDTRTAAEAALVNLPAFIAYRKQVEKKA